MRSPSELVKVDPNASIIFLSTKLIGIGNKCETRLDSETKEDPFEV